MLVEDQLNRESCCRVRNRRGPLVAPDREVGGFATEPYSQGQRHFRGQAPLVAGRKSPTKRGFRADDVLPAVPVVQIDLGLAGAGAQPPAVLASPTNAITPVDMGVVELTQGLVPLASRPSFSFMPPAMPSVLHVTSSTLDPETGSLRAQSATVKIHRRRPAPVTPQRDRDLSAPSSPGAPHSPNPLSPGQGAGTAHGSGTASPTKPDNPPAGDKLL